MAMARYLAMTASEIEYCPVLPEHIAWMSCHFSPYTTGLSNLPGKLPEGSLLTVNDLTPIHGHSPQAVLQQLSACTEALSCSGVLLDFQRPGNPETTQMVKELSGALPCPVAVSACYGAALSCAVFLPPVPLDVPPEVYFAPWQGRELWLELASEKTLLCLMPEGLSRSSLSAEIPPEGGQQEETLRCHYAIDLQPGNAQFTLWRTQEDLELLLQDAAHWGVTTAVGLYQEFSSYKKEFPS